jgi:hypothetical protein
MPNRRIIPNAKGDRADKPVNDKGLPVPFWKLSMWGNPQT